MTVTVLHESRTTEVGGAGSDARHLWLDPAELEAASGWKLENRGLCRGDTCVELAPAWQGADGRVDFAAFAAHLGQPVIRDPGTGTWAFGEAPDARQGRIGSLEAPDFRLPDLEGRMHALSDYRGRKVFLYSWGSY